MSGLYIHLPFCLSKCPYCSFVSFPGLEKIQGRYVRALDEEIQRIPQENGKQSIRTVFFGGGTPTLLPAEMLISILHTCRKHFALEDECEISVEANPGTVNKEDLLCLRDAGFNRISIGIQSLVDTELARIGRQYASSTAEKILVESQSAGFENISVDLMYGLPGQNAETWEYSLTKAIGYGPDHISCYQLTLEEGTALARDVASKTLTVASEDEAIQMEELALVRTRSAGIEQYEISNYARPGFECRHNLNYWKNGSYYAVGAGAVSYVDGVRKKRISSPVEYCRLLEDGESPVIEEEVLDNESSFRESVVMGLRMIKGVHRQTLSARYGLEVEAYYGKLLLELQQRKLLVLDREYLRLTARGRRFANRVMADLV